MYLSNRKLNKANDMLSKLRHVLDINTLRSVYCAIFESHLCYASLVWARNTNSVKRLRFLKKKSLRITLFPSRNSHTWPLFKLSKFLKSFDKTALEKCIFISKSLNGLLPSIFNNWFKFSLRHALMILDGQILLILKYALTVLKPMVGTQCL